MTNRDILDVFYTPNVGLPTPSRYTVQGAGGTARYLIHAAPAPEPGGPGVLLYVPGLTLNDVARILDLRADHPHECDRCGNLNACRAWGAACDRPTRLPGRCCLS